MGGKKLSSKETAATNSKQNNLVQYPLPYKVVDGCLYKEVTNKSGITSKKLCNFLPYIVSEVSVDDGAEVKTVLRLGGVHSSGRVLPEIDVTGAELGSFNWLIERWGADCVLELERSVKEYVRHAIQQTAENAERIQICNVTGWKLIDNHWEYLLPNDGKRDVSLRGKLSRYEKADDWKISDLANVFLMINTMPFAPAEITLPLLAYTFLTPLNEFLHQANCEPKFVLCLLGRTGTRKSTLAALFLSFFGRFNSSDLPLSFRDTANSIMYNSFSLKDVLTCILNKALNSKKHTVSDNDSIRCLIRFFYFNPLARLIRLFSCSLLKPFVASINSDTLLGLTVAVSKNSSGVMPRYSQI